MIDLSGRYFIDGMDIWTAFGMFVESGSDGFLQYPANKGGITHDWKDSNGIDVDVSQIFLTSRDIVLKCSILASDETAFWTNYNNFLSLMVTPGLRRIQVAQFAGKSYQVFYKDCTIFNRFTRIIGADDTHKIACKLSVTFTETNPAPNTSDIFIVDEDSRFLIT